MTKNDIALVIARYYSDLEQELELTEEEKELANDPNDTKHYQDKCDVVIEKLRLLSNIRRDLQISDIKFWRGLKIAERQNKKELTTP
ncbi:hypothetical protein ABE060_23325 [Bacillus rugosus]|uniref:hypothetical protein n=1 Tax=Bacillus rugosus TaxID=2715209 RepID=UPI001584BB9B|nr:hypothetical protein [Bacillus rugosus]NUF07898.1 hypothetical protein [Bacillus rugosus]